MCEEDDEQLALVKEAMISVNGAVESIAKARERCNEGRSQFSWQMKNFNRIMKCLDSAEAKIWDAKAMLSGARDEILEALAKEEGEGPDLPGFGG